MCFYTDASVPQNVTMDMSDIIKMYIFDAKTDVRHNVKRLNNRDRVTRLGDFG